MNTTRISPITLQDSCPLGDPFLSSTFNDEGWEPSASLLMPTDLYKSPSENPGRQRACPYLKCIFRRNCRISILGN